MNLAWVEACQALVDDSGTMRSIAEEVARKHRITVKELRGPSRRRELVIARHEAFARCRDELLKTYTQIGRFFGDRDHSSVVYGCQRYRGEA
jgi:chromosomal replication initiator protein